ncbi:MAG: hypothetical protein ABSH32_29465 [Bryobacteraceae bacterium]|jgi:hypothetical protein
MAPPATPGGSWTETVLNAFKKSGSPSNVYVNLLLGPNGVLFGAGGGGTDNVGLIFELAPPTSPGDAWREIPLYNFTGGSDGWAPSAPLVFRPNGVLYGVTERGGSSPACLNLGCGTVFELKV